MAALSAKPKATTVVTNTQSLKLFKYWNGVETPDMDLFMFLRLKPEVIEQRSIISNVLDKSTLKCRV